MYLEPGCLFKSSMILDNSMEPLDIGLDAVELINILEVILNIEEMFITESHIHYVRFQL
jgi:hypothetical protein